MNILLKIISAIILLSVLGSGLVLAGCSSGSASDGGSDAERLAPDFQLLSLDGQTISLSDFRGKPVLLNFWATWCGPCKFEMPFLQEIYEDEEWLEKGLVILAVDVGENPARVKLFASSLKLSFTVLLDIDQDVALQYNLRAFPTTFFLDKDGIIQDAKIGAFADRTEIEKRLGKIVP